MQRICLFLLFFLCTTMPAWSHPEGQVEYIENRGQWDGPFRYRATVTNNATVFLEETGFTYLKADPASIPSLHPHERDAAEMPKSFRAHAWKMHFKGANPHPRFEAGKQQTHYYNYFLGKDPARWQSGIQPALEVRYRQLYPGIDLRAASESGQIKYEFELAAGADPSQIVLAYEGIENITLAEGKLRFNTSVGPVEEARPYAWQPVNGQRRQVACQYVLAGQEVRYAFPEGYDKSLPLVIDPTVVFATYTGSTADNWGFTATYDNAGNFYAGGIVSVSGAESYPTTTGAIQTSYGGGNMGSIFPCDMTISKFSANGASLLYSTYLGGSNNEQPHSMVVDASGNLYLTGRTYSANFPVVSGSYDNSFNGVADLVVCRFNPTGTALLGSTYMGGTDADGINISTSVPTTSATLHYNYGDDARSEILADRQGNVYVTASSQSTNFPTVNAFQSAKNGGQDMVVFKLDPSLSNLLWSTYYGGSGDDAGYVLTFDTAENYVYVGGGTASSDFPMPTGGWQSSYQGGRTDGFVLRFQNGGSYARTGGSFIGQSGYDQVFGLQTDEENSIYLMGQTLGGTFPVSAGVYSNAGSSQFMMAMDGALSTNLRSTVIGNGNSVQPNISPVAFLVDTCGNVYLSGWGGRLGGNNPNQSGMRNLPITPGALQSTTDNSDFYFIVLNRNMSSLLYGTYRGGSGDEHVDGGTSRFDKNGVVYQSICGGCGGNSSFPATSGAYSTQNGSNNCNLVALKIAFDLGAVRASANAVPSARGCVPFNVTFNNTSSNATTYSWDFGDGTSGSTAASPAHTFTRRGTFQVRLIARNPAACITVDTSYLTIVVDSSAASASFTTQITNSCGPYTVDVANSSPSSSAATYSWDFGDGTTFNGYSPGTKTYADTGTYTIRLIVNDPNACISPDTAEQTVALQGFQVKANFRMPDSVCLSSRGILFQSNSQNATGLLWRFGDGATATAAAPVHSYASVGTYTVSLVATNPASCNKRDSISQVLKVKEGPRAAFTFTPTFPEPNTPTQFRNQSVNAVSYFWNFGDGNNSSETHPLYQYKKTGTYTVCLTARSQEGCTDTVCNEVEADVRIACDVPTAFSPNGDGKNDVLYVRGAAITRLSFKLFNRWGQLIFETTDKNKGWDGTFNGKPQEADAYAYILSAEFFDGSSLQKNGNITLIR